MKKLPKNYKVTDIETNEDITIEFDRQLETTEKTRQVRAEHFQRQNQRKEEFESSELRQHVEDLNGFIWANFTPLVSFKEKYVGLKESHYARLMYMATFLNHNTNQLKKDNGHEIKKKHIQGMIAASERATRDFIKDVKEHDLLSFDKYDNVYLHHLFTKGRTSGRGYSHTRMYRKSIRDLYELADGRDVKKLGVIFNVIPYIDFRINVLCHNADEMVRNSNDLIIMTLKELADKLGFKDPHKLKETLHTFKIDGQRVVHITKDQNEKSIIIVNPKFVYAGGHEDYAKNADFLKDFNTLSGTSIFFSNKRLQK